MKFYVVFYMISSPKKWLKTIINALRNGAGTVNNKFFYFKFDILGFLAIGNLQKKFRGSISKIVDFSLMSNFC